MFSIPKFNDICGDNAVITKIAECDKECSILEQTISELKDSIHDINPDLKTSVIQKQKTDINRKIKKHQTKLKTIQKRSDKLRSKRHTSLIELKSKYFEQFNAKIMNPVSFLRKAYNEICLYNKSNFEEIYRNVLIDDKQFVNEWLIRPNIRTYERLDFLPPPVSVPSYIYNTFDGFAVEKVVDKTDAGVDIDKTDVSTGTNNTSTSGTDSDKNNIINADTNNVSLINPILKHIEILTNHDGASYEYVLNYFAHLIQKPGELAQVALVFRSEKEGVGKNLMFEEFIGRSILGYKYVLQTTDIDKIVGRFSMINNKLLVILDETKGKDTFLNSDKIKNFITTNTIAWERKGVDGFNINNFARLLFFTNNDTPVSIPYGDRRFACFDCSNEVANNRKYFRELVRCMRDSTVIKAFYLFLKSRDISRFDIVTDRPETRFYKELREHSIPCIARFLINYISDDSNNNQIYARDLFDSFKKWSTDTNRDVSYNDNRFGRELKKYTGITKKRTNKGQKYTLDFDAIQQCMIDKQYLSKDDCVIDCDSDTE